MTHDLWPWMTFGGHFKVTKWKSPVGGKPSLIAYRWLLTLMFPSPGLVKQHFYRWPPRGLSDANLILYLRQSLSHSWFCVTCSTQCTVQSQRREWSDCWMDVCSSLSQNDRRTSTELDGAELTDNIAHRNRLCSLCWLEGKTEADEV